MACLRVPFEGNSIQELFRKIDKGVIAKIPSRYSKDLYDAIKLCLTKDQKKRPTVEEMLNHPMIKKRNKDGEYMISGDTPDFILGELMNTIRLPKNLDLLIQRLPKKRYNDTKKRASSVGGKKKEDSDESFSKKGKGEGDHKLNQFIKKDIQ